MSTKKYEDVISLARHLPEWSFVVVGFAEDRDYVARLKSQIDSLKLRNVFLKTDLTEDKKKKELETAGVYLHMQFTEPFGIAIVEAIQAGCIPIVPDNAGPREIVNLPELRFANKTDVFKIIQYIQKKGSDLHEKLIQNYLQHIAKNDLSKFVDTCLDHIYAREQENKD